jgi:hypothetical protein
LLLVAAIAIAGFGLSAGIAMAQSEQFIPRLVNRTGSYAPNGIPFADGYADYLGMIDARSLGNTRLPQWLERLLQPVVITLDLHLHHSIAYNEANANFGAVLSVWDRLFGTYVRLPRAHQGEARLRRPRVAAKRLPETLGDAPHPWRIPRAVAMD